MTCCSVSPSRPTTACRRGGWWACSRDAREKGLITRVPAFATLLKYREDPRTIFYLRHLIEQSSLPLKEVETDFAADSSWFPASPLGDGVQGSKQPVPVKAHVMCGVKTLIITSAIVTPHHSGDAPQFKSLLDATANHHNVREVSADKAYLSKENLRAAERVGATPYIPFRSNSRRVTAYGKPDVLWERAWFVYHFNRAQFLEHYHKRSNVETLFHVVKTRFGRRVLSAVPAARVNEVLLRLLCHNVCVLIRSAHELDILPILDV